MVNSPGDCGISRKSRKGKEIGEKEKAQDRKGKLTGDRRRGDIQKGKKGKERLCVRRRGCMKVQRTGQERKEKVIGEDA